MSISKKQLAKLRAEAKLEIGEVNDQQIPKYIAEIKEIISNRVDGIIPHPSTYDGIYLQCIRAAKYDIQRAAKLYKNFCKIRQKSVQGVREISIPSLQEKLFQTKVLAILASRDYLGRQVLLIRISKWDPKEIQLDSIFASMFLLLDEALTSEDTQLQGFIIVAECKDFSWAHARQVGLSHLQAFFKTVQDSYPARFKGIHILNNHSLINALLAASKPFLKEKIRNRIFCHGADLGSFHKFIDPSILPEFLGGRVAEDDYDDRQLVNKLMQKDDYYKGQWKAVEIFYNTAILNQL